MVLDTIAQLPQCPCLSTTKVIPGEKEKAATVGYKEQQNMKFAYALGYIIQPLI